MVAITLSVDWHSDRSLGVRRVLLPSIVLFAISFAAISLAPASLPVFVALYAMSVFAAPAKGSRQSDLAPGAV